ncbi:ester cyclase [Rhodoligotrophos ferricapiens]|uniref:ester cyclase n=1 Tax=Rhodoligotrophos ferricapiens TaxID=3069264 RepID=UPI00315C6352
MTPQEVRDFATRLMDEVWRTFDDQAVERFYRRDVIGHHREQTLGFEDIVARLQRDVGKFGAPVYDIADIIAEQDKFAIRFIFSCTLLPANTPIATEAIYFYHLRDGKIAEFWLLSDTPFDYRQ